MAFDNSPDKMKAILAMLPPKEMSESAPEKAEGPDYEKQALYIGNDLLKAIEAKDAEAIGHIVCDAIRLHIAQADSEGSDSSEY